MKFDWNPDKNKWLKDYRSINFDEITCLIDNGYLMTILNHPKKAKQKIFVVERDGYAYNVPFVEETDGTCFLKTIYPSRSSTKKYLRR
ncbi:MAG: toxin [bacterium]